MNTNPAHVDSDPKHLYPPFWDLVQQVLAQANHESAGKFPHFHEWRPFEGYRSIARQEWLYEEGRTRAPIGKKFTVTNDRVPRRHGNGLAVDIVWFDRSGNPSWDNEDLYNILGHCVRSQKEGKKMLLEWGGSWTSPKDMPHVQPNRVLLARWKPLAKAYLHSLGLTTPDV